MNLFSLCMSLLVLFIVLKCSFSYLNICLFFKIQPNPFGYLPFPCWFVKVLDTNHLLDICKCKYFSQSMACLSIFLIDSWRAEIFEVQFVKFSFYVYCFFVSRLALQPMKPFHLDKQWTFQTQHVYNLIYLTSNSFLIILK